LWSGDSWKALFMAAKWLQQPLRFFSIWCEMPAGLSTRPIALMIAAWTEQKMI
jgi:hypothetical protein